MTKKGIESCSALRNSHDKATLDKVENWDTNIR